MRVLVTGAAGFLGRHVTRRFRDGGWSVTGFDRAPVEVEGIRTIQGDLTDLETVRDSITGLDVVAHVGAVGDVYLAAKDPILAAEVNVIGTANVARAALEHGARVVYASTWEVYGAPQYEPLDEEHPTMPDHPYSITKLAGESMLLSTAHLEGLQAVALRLGTAYGTGLRPNSVFRIFIDLARRGEPITVQGDGSQSRQFTHAADIAEAFARAAESSVSGIPLNIVSPDSITIKQLALSITDKLPTEVVFGEPRPGDVPSAYVTAEKATDVLGWSPSVGFDEGLAELIDS